MHQIHNCVLSLNDNFVAVSANAGRKKYASENFQQLCRAHVISHRYPFDHVMDLFLDESFLQEYPLHIKFEGEMPVDSGTLVWGLDKM